MGAEGDPCERAVGEGVLGGEPATGQDPGVAGLCETARGDGERLGPGGRAELAVLSDPGVADPVVGVEVAEREAVLVGDPLLVDLGVVAGQAAHHLAAPVVHPDRGAAGVVLGDRRGRDQVERARTEAVLGAGQRADGTDLDRVAREVGLEGLLLVDADLLEGTPLDQRDEGVAGDLLGEARTARAQHAALAVEQHLGGDVDRLGERALHATARGEAGLATAVAHGLVLQGALATLVADRAVERVVDQEELHDPLLRLVGHVAGRLGVDHHALRDRDRAGRLWLGERAAVAGVRDVDQALAARTDRLEQRVVAEPRDLCADLLGGTDHQGVLGNADLDAVDGQGHQVGLLDLGCAHAGPPRCRSAAEERSWEVEEQRGTQVMKSLPRRRTRWRRRGRTDSHLR